jgi:hypothetical protein
MDAGMRSKPLSNRTTGVAGEVVVDQVEVTDRVRGVDGIEQLEEAGGIPGGAVKVSACPWHGRKDGADILYGTELPSPIWLAASWRA